MRKTSESKSGVARPRAVRMSLACGLVACSLLAAAADGQPGWARVSSPAPPSAGAVSAAAGQVSKRAAELNAARVQLAADNARLASLRVQSEQVIERYDQAIVDEHQAALAYHAAQKRLAKAEQTERVSRERVAGMAARDYEAGGGFGTLATMLGNSGGPQAFAEGASAEQQLAQEGVDLLSQNQAAKIVAGVFRAQTRRELTAEQAAARRAAALKAAILAAVARQQAAVRASEASTKRLEAALGAAQAREYELAQARQRGLAAEQARRQALLAQQARADSPVTSPSSPGGGSSSGGWPSAHSLAQGASAAQGNIAADWALTQIGKPYQWGGAGPSTYDCSGLTMDAWARAGVRLLHWTGYQWPSGPHIPLDQLRRGDLLFFATDTSDPATIHHVGIYIGNGEMVDAPYTGVDVRIDTIYQPGGLIGATRPAG
ncbi:MAG TPA: C40 family peptidase [Streptosporangiaceae bacterium]